MSRPVPEEPNFKDNFEDKPLGNVSEEIERMMKERNLEINNIQKNKMSKKAEEWISQRILQYGIIQSKKVTNNLPKTLNL